MSVVELLSERTSFTAIASGDFGYSASICVATEAAARAEAEKAAAADEKGTAIIIMAGTTLTLDLPDKYYGKIVTVYVSTTVKGKITFKKLDYFVLDKKDGAATITSKIKLAKGQTIQVKVGSKVVKSVKF